MSYICYLYHILYYIYIMYTHSYIHLSAVLQLCDSFVAYILLYSQFILMCVKCVFQLPVIV